ncbi:MAG: molybdopterin-dependent oxidoreductase, partial [Candidatus Fermentibacteraceae bacterium]|nr:molybdopterin-dependent oxidoreductase [Candidatus Fermentibacteraceae bacterium]
SNGFEPEDNEHECARCLSCGCVRFDDCDLRLYAEEYGVDMEIFKGHARKHKVDDRHPYLSYDPNKCVLCARCIRTCAKVLPISAIGLVGRGFKTEMRPAMNDPLVETSCISCGNCVDACPTGALTVKYPFKGRACLETTDISTHCGFCSVGCKITVRKFGDGRYFTTSSGVPGDYLCRYGRFGQELFIKQDRIAQPVVRSGNSYSTVAFDDANGRIVEFLKDAVEKYGPASVAVFVSPELTNEELYIAGRIAREGIGTNNIGSLAIISGGFRSGVLDKVLGFTASTADRKCLRDADLIICNNTSMEEDHLILAIEVIQSVKDGARLIVSKSMLDATDQHLASLAVDPMRGRASIFWNAVMQVLLDSGDIAGSSSFLENRNVSIEMAAARSGVAEESILDAAELLRNSGNIVFIHSPDRPQDASPDDITIFADLAIMLTSAGKKTDILLPRLIANSAGLEVMGADPAFLPGKAPAGEQPGAATSQELRKILENGGIRAALVIGENPLEYNRTGSWFQNVEFLAAVDWTNTETTRFADVVLPGSTFLESAGTMCNFEGGLTAFTRAASPPSGMTATETLSCLAKAFGVDIADDLFAEIDQVVRKNLGDLARFYWNTGEKRNWDGEGELVSVVADAKATSILPPMTHSQEYRKEIREVGTERFRVQ